MKLLVLCAALLLIGCGEDEESIHAQCRIEKIKSNVSVTLCMDARGYDYTWEKQESCGYNIESSNCFEKRGLLRSAKLSMMKKK